MDDAIRNHGRLVGVEIRHLAALEAVVETGSFGRAGVELGYSQSAISQQIAALERAAGLTTARASRRAPAGDADRGGAAAAAARRRASAAMRAAEADLHALAEGEAGTLRVGTFQSAGVRLLPGAMRRYVERWPGVQVRLVEAGYDEELLALLERGELDLAFVLENDDPAFERTASLSDPYVLLAPSDLGAGPERAPDPPPGDRRAAADRLPPCRRRARRRSFAPEASSPRSSSARTRAASSRASSAPGSATPSCRSSVWTRTRTWPCSRSPASRRA